LNDAALFRLATAPTTSRTHQGLSGTTSRYQGIRTGHPGSKKAVDWCYVAAVVASGMVDQYKLEAKGRQHQTRRHLQFALLLRSKFSIIHISLPPDTGRDVFHGQTDMAFSAARRTTSTLYSRACYRTPLYDCGLMSVCKHSATPPLIRESGSPRSNEAPTAIISARRLPRWLFPDGNAALQRLLVWT
jgi:hypothetical protein